MNLLHALYLANQLNLLFFAEDACQFTEKLTEHTYRGSYEKIANAILKYNGNRLIDVVRFYEQVIVSYLIGNNDMHLKNFSLIAKKQGAYELAPGYDILSVQLLMPEDDEELALTLNGRKKKLKKRDFDTAMLSSGVPKKAVENLWGRTNKGAEKWGALLDHSFLNKENKAKLEELLILKKEQIK